MSLSGIAEEIKWQKEKKYTKKSNKTAEWEFSQAEIFFPSFASVFF